MEFPYIPDSKNQPLVCDMTSNFPSRSFDINRFGVVFGSAQKNIGIAGVAFVIVDEDLIKPRKDTPVIADY